MGEENHFYEVGCHPENILSEGFVRHMTAGVGEEFLPFLVDVAE